MSAGTVSIGFTDSQLDMIYKLYKNSSSLSVTFVLTTAGSYSDSKVCKVVLKGNQKTVRERINGSWKRGKVFVKVDGHWKRAVVWIKVNGVWKRGF